MKVIMRWGRSLIIHVCMMGIHIRDRGRVPLCKRTTWAVSPLLSYLTKGALYCLSLHTLGWLTLNSWDSSLSISPQLPWHSTHGPTPTCPGIHTHVLTLAGAICLAYHLSWHYGCQCSYCHVNLDVEPASQCPLHPYAHV